MRRFPFWAIMILDVVGLMTCGCMSRNVPEEDESLWVPRKLDLDNNVTILFRTPDENIRRPDIYFSGEVSLEDIPKTNAHYRKLYRGDFDYSRSGDMQYVLTVGIWHTTDAVFGIDGSGDWAEKMKRYFDGDANTKIMGYNSSIISLGGNKWICLETSTPLGPMPNGSTGWPAFDTEYRIRICPDFYLKIGGSTLCIDGDESLIIRRRELTRKVAESVEIIWVKP